MIDHEPQDTSPLDRPKAHIKGRFWSGLENVLKGAKKHWKEIVTAIALPFIFNNNVKAGGLFLNIYSYLTNPKIYVNHINGATEPEEGYNNGLDAEFFPMPWPPTIDFYSKIESEPFRLTRDTRPPESMSTITSEIVGVGLPSPVTGAELDPLIWYPSGEDNFSKYNWRIGKRSISFE